jgi:tetratricopeptide (TPR) repeat protein
MRNLARLHADARRRSEAVEAYRAAVEAGERLCAEYGRTTANVDVLAGALLGQADAMHGPTGEKAVALLERALSLQLAADAEDEDPDHLQTLGEVYLNLGSAVASTGRVEAALEIFNSGIEHFRRVAADFPEVPAFTSLYTDLLISAATARTELHRDLDEIIETMSAAVEIKRELAAAHPEVVDYAYRLSLALNNLAVSYFLRGDTETCRRLSVESERQGRRAIAQGPGEPSHVRALDMAQFSLAELSLIEGDHAGAAALLDEIEGRGLDEIFGHRSLGEGYARCASLALEDETLSPEARAELSERNAQRGLDHLAHAVELGFNDMGFLEQSEQIEILRASPYFADVVEAARHRDP